VLSQAVIIAGGKGTRLRSIIEDKPKILVNLETETLLDYQIQYLKNNGIKKIHFCLGYKYKQILQHLKNVDIEFTYSIEDQPLGTYGALLNAKNFLDETFFILYGDVLTNFNIQHGYKSFINSNSDFHLVLRYTNHPEDSDIVNFNKDNQVISISRLRKKEQLVMPIGNTSLLFAKKKAINEMPEQKASDLFRDYLNNNLKRLKITGLVSIDYIRDIGTKERYESEISKYKEKITKPYKVVFMDRDGTLIQDQGNENNINKLKFNKLSLEILKYLQSKNFKVILISNQPGIAKGFFTKEDVDKFNATIQYKLIENQLEPIDDIFICPHHPDKGFKGEVKKLKISCTCRKPNTGLVENAISRHSLDKGNFLFIGDTLRDYELSKKINSPFCLIQSNLSESKYFNQTKVKPITSLEEFVKKINKLNFV